MLALLYAVSILISYERILFSLKNFSFYISLESEATVARRIFNIHSQEFS
jgi:hypothetical protein